MAPPVVAFAAGESGGSPRLKSDGPSQAAGRLPGIGMLVAIILYGRSVIDLSFVGITRHWFRVRLDGDDRRSHFNRRGHHHTGRHHYRRSHYYTRTTTTGGCTTIGGGTDTGGATTIGGPT